MGNRHIKIINGRKYYYQSIRKGKKVTSKYLGPVGDRKRKPKDEIEMPGQQDPALQEDSSYIG